MPQYLVTEVLDVSDVKPGLEKSLSCLNVLIWAFDPAEAAREGVMMWSADHDVHQEWETVTVKVTGPLDNPMTPWLESFLDVKIKRTTEYSATYRKVG